MTSVVVEATSRRSPVSVLEDSPLNGNRDADGIVSCPYEQRARVRQLKETGYNAMYSPLRRTRGLAAETAPPKRAASWRTFMIGIVYLVVMGKD